MISDDILEQTITKHRITCSPHDLRTILERVAATPASRFRGDWWRIVAPDATPDTVWALRNLAALVTLRPAPKDPSRLDRLRAIMLTADIDALIVPQADEHQVSSIPRSARRLEWLTDFSGSAGTAVVARERAWLFVDGRYVLQAQSEVDSSRYEIRHFRTPPIWEYLAEHFAAGSKLGFDPRLHNMTEVRHITQALAPAGHRLVSLERNLIDLLWLDRPPPPLAPLVPHETEYSGRRADEKQDEVAELLRTKQADAFVLNQLEPIAWLLNIRGGDATYSPLPQAYSVVFNDGHTELFVERQKVTPAVMNHLGNRTTVRDIVEFGEALREVGRRGLTVALDPDKATQWMHDALAGAGARIVTVRDPTSEGRTRKNVVELQNFSDAMERDGAALSRFIRWVSEEAIRSPVSEMAASERVIAFRAEDPLFRGPSFEPIVAAGPHAAITHYHPTPETDRLIEPGMLLLVDSGGQYLSGTTDITRTIAIGDPSDEARRYFTIVLKSHVALATARFPKGATGAQLDAIARGPLWKAGINFDHGTGHGIGSYLSVHEGPAGIAEGTNYKLDVGMVISNEPGAYLAGRFGIRIENTITVVPAGLTTEGGVFLAFATLSLAPIDRRLIDLGLLTLEEIAWVDSYHATVRQKIGPRLAGEDAAWLERATAPLA
jgi:Xaa-Pro aminopeptidase